MLFLKTAVPISGPMMTVNTSTPMMT